VHGNVPHLTMVLLLGDGRGKVGGHDRTRDPGTELPARARSESLRR
jgi:hypothetical protein